MPSTPIFYESNEAGLSTERGYFESPEESDPEVLLRASEEDRRNQVVVIQEIVADRDAWIGYFKQLEADRDAWVVRYESIRSQMIAHEHNPVLRQLLIRQLVDERDAVAAQSRG